jgi:hypothetical protein
MKIPCSNCRANCVRVLLSETVSVAAPAIEPPLATGLRNDKDFRICPTQPSSTSPAALGRKSAFRLAIPKKIAPPNASRL